MPADMETLKNLEIFKDLENDELEEVGELIKPMKVMEGEMITRMGDTAKQFFIVISGNYLIEFPEGRATTLHEKGDVMGWSTLITPFSYKGTATALTDGELLTMSGSEFQRLLQDNASLSEKIMMKLSAIIDERMSLYLGEKDKEHKEV